MTLGERELAKRKEFDEAYRQASLPAMHAIERKVCGCDYGATSWATRDEADLTADMLDLRPGARMLEIGAGSGWPALYLGARTGCHVVLTDLTLDGLRIAARRAAADDVSGDCLAADAACQPFTGGSFDALNHSDVLCCLVRKREVLDECRRLIRPAGRMVFSVIYVPSGLSAKDHTLAVEAAPEFVETAVDYPTLLEATDWGVLDRRDLTAALADSCMTRLRVEREAREDLLRLTDPAELYCRWARLERRIAALEGGILKRELFLVAPKITRPDCRTGQRD